MPVDGRLSVEPDRGHDGPVSRNLGSSAIPSSLHQTAPSAVRPAVPAAARVTRPGWRDPRLWVGVLIVAISVVAGARLLASADDSVGVWAVGRDMGAGDTVTSADLVVRQVRFAEAGDLDHYFDADAAVPADLQLLRGVGAGELLPRAAVGPPGDEGLLQLPVAVDAEQVPPTVAAGSVVDVYVLPSGGGRCASRCAPVLTGSRWSPPRRWTRGSPPRASGSWCSGSAATTPVATSRPTAASTSPVVTVVRRG